MRKKLIILAIWIIIWEILALIINNAILFASPIDTVKALFGLLSRAEFYKSIGNSLLNIILGMLSGIVVGSVFAIVGRRFKVFDEFAGPFIRLCRTVPVVCFIVIFLIWFGAPRISFFIVLSVTIPLVYINLSAALKGVDSKLLEMADIFEMKKSYKIHYIYYPQIYESVKASLTLIAGVAFKSGAAAEVIGQTGFSLGNGIYRSKINLDTPGIFAWTLVIIALSFITEKLVVYLAGRFMPGAED